MARAAKTNVSSAARDYGRDYPLIVDLDGTLIRTDSLHESLCKLAREKPSVLWQLPRWCLGGKARLKEQVALHTKINPDTWPVNRELLDWLTAQRADGRTLVLCTAADRTVAQAIGGNLGIFDEILASDGTRNLAGMSKAEALVQRFGHQGFDYVGNSHHDLAVWRHARRAIVVNASQGLTERADACSTVERVFSPPAVGLAVWGRVLRLHQWLKNLLLAVPIIAAHEVMRPDLLTPFVLAFLSFSLTASAVYICNDLLDLEDDREHPRKASRPFAAGLVPVGMGLALVPLLIAVSLTSAFSIGRPFVSWLLVYLGVTCAYSFWLKRLLLIDCLTLAMLYTVRILAGASVADIEPSFWLMAFSCFFFLSLAFAKRYAELRLLSHAGQDHARGRAYRISDAPLIQILGITSGYAAVVVMALYLNSASVVKLYRTPQVLWAGIPVTLFWISWMWTQAHRELLHEDAVVFAVTDRVSLLTGVAFACVLAAGTVTWSW
ncbi:MAG TPA: UbiA family prenyltransferase [Nitrospira sp.]|nr:UbiA family prenyltransferase [Nitrospira sp.]